MNEIKMSIGEYKLLLSSVGKHDCRHILNGILFSVDGDGNGQLVSTNTHILTVIDVGFVGEKNLRKVLTVNAFKGRTYFKPTIKSEAGIDLRSIRDSEIIVGEYPECNSLVQKESEATVPCFAIGDSGRCSTTNKLRIYRDLAFDIVYLLNIYKSIGECVALCEDNGCDLSPAIIRKGRCTHVVMPIR